MEKKLDELLSWLVNCQICKGPFGLARMEFLMDRLGNPQQLVPGVLIGGTNGKGSVTVILESILTATQEYEAGATISPHLVSVTERIRHKGNRLPDSFWLKGLQQIYETAKLMERESSLGAPSFFEMVTALAYLAFAEYCDIAFIEVGLGGRLDATNVKRAEVAVVTNVGTDHKEFLGQTREAIATEKVGILKEKGVLVTGETDPTILKLFSDRCTQLNAELITVSPEIYFDEINSSARGHSIRLKSNGKLIYLPLAGKHQLKNLAISLAVIERLRKNGFHISDEAIENGVKNVKWPGRLDFIEGKPSILLDGAHNAEAITSLIEYLKEYPMLRPSTIIFGSLKNKPGSLMAKELAKHGDSLIFVPPPTKRSLSKDEFEAEIAPTDPRWVWCEDLTTALAQANSASSVLITGSLYLVGEYYKITNRQI